MSINFSNFCLGTVQFGKQYGLKNIREKVISDNDIEDIFNFFYLNDGVYIDTARNYGNSETIISNFLNKKSKVISKFEISEENELISDIEYSLKDLGIDKLDTALIHNPEKLKSNNRSFNNLVKAKEEGLCSNIGLSVYSYSDIESINIDMLIEKIDVIQVQGNAFDKHFFKNRNINILKSKNIRIDIRSIFLQGLLLQELNISKNLFPAYKKDLSSWHSYCNENNMSLLNGALLNAITLYNGKSLLLFGCRNLKEIQTILAEMMTLNISKPLFNIEINKFLSDPRLWKN